VCTLRRPHIPAAGPQCIELERENLCAEKNAAQELASSICAVCSYVPSDRTTGNDNRNGLRCRAMEVSQAALERAQIWPDRADWR
jgi:hypothetical protein